MTITAQNSLNYKFNFRGDYILHKQTEEEVNSGINEMNQLPVDKTNELNKLKAETEKENSSTLSSLPSVTEVFI
ncbi:unnamed protein product [Heterobilharzia americana]|nr:unnamed protein product [Heterobilharzia americana]